MKKEQVKGSETTGSHIREGRISRFVLYFHLFHFKGVLLKFKRLNILFKKY